MGGGGKHHIGAAGAFGALASVKSMYIIAVSLEMKADGIKGLGAVIGDGGLEIFLYMVIYLFAVVVKFPLQGDIENHWYLLKRR